MSAKVATAPKAPSREEQAHIDQWLDLMTRFIDAGITEPTRLPRVPDGTITLLLPDADPSFVERELTAATNMVRRGFDVYLHHVRVTDLPELPAAPAEPTAGLRRTMFAWDGSIASQEIRGADGEWHRVEPPEPVDE